MTTIHQVSTPSNKIDEYPFVKLNKMQEEEDIKMNDNPLQPNGIGKDDSWQHRMRDRITHQRPSLEGHVAREETADATNGGAD